MNGLIPPLPLIERDAVGVVVPIPTFPPVVARVVVPSVVRLVNAAVRAVRSEE